LATPHEISVIDLRRQLDRLWQELPGPGLLRGASLFFTLFAISLLLSVAAAQIFFLCSGLCYAMDLLRRPRVPRFPPIKLSLGLFCIFTVLSLVWAENPAVGWTAVRKLTLFLIILLAVNLIGSLRRLAFIYRVMFIEAALAGILAVAQFIVQYREIRAEHPGQFYYYMTLMRIHGFMGHWMTFGGQQMLIFVALAAYVLSLSRTSPAPGAAPIDSSRIARRASSSWRTLLPWSGLLLIVLVSLVLNFTRGVWLGCGVALLYLIARWRARWLWLLPLGALAIYLAAPALLRQRLQTLLHPSSDPAITVRFEMWHVGLNMIRRHPLVGVGPNNVNEVYLAYLPRGVVPVAAWHEHLHDVYLQLAAERGLPCFAAWLWLMGLWGWHTLRIRQKLAGGESTGGESTGAVWIADACFAGWLAFVAEGFFEFNFGTTPVLMVFLLFMSVPFTLVESTRNRESLTEPKAALSVQVAQDSLHH
jgi:O-antigen ligase